MKFWEIKEEIRVIGIDDASFDLKIDKTVLCVGTVFRGSKSIDGVLSCYITIDSLDSTEKFASMINESRHKNQLRIIKLSQRNSSY